MNEFDNFLFKNTVVPRNRKEIRAMMQDRKRFEPELKTLGDIVENTQKEMSEVETKDEKIATYLFGLDYFNKLCDKIERVKRPKYWKLNRKFYTEIVKPVV